MSDLEYLIEMGFPRLLAEQALNSTGNKGLNAAMDWLVERQGDTETSGTQIDAYHEQPTVEAKHFKCDDCSKFFRSSEDVQIHNALTGHEKYSESFEEIKPLTDEERKAQMDKLQELLRQKKLEREAAEKQAELEHEKVRRRHGKDIVSAKAKFEEEQIRLLVEQKKREKEEEKAYREKLKADIAREREEKKIRNHGEFRPTEPPQLITPPPQCTKCDVSICRLQIRLPTGPPLKCDFSPSEPLSAVILYISQHWPDAPSQMDIDSISVMTTFPKREYSNEELQAPLSALGLCPSAVLTARQKS